MEIISPILKRAEKDRQWFGIRWVRTYQSSMQVIAAVYEWANQDNGMDAHYPKRHQCAKVVVFKTTEQERSVRHEDYINWY